MACSFPVGIAKKDGTATCRPCGTCMNCRLDYSKQWAVRCMCEAQMHDENSFVTLTYNDQNLPVDGSIRKGEVQKFLKRLRKRIEPKKVRFFGSGEYGKEYDRPHYHLCLFGFDFPDRQVLSAHFRRKKDHDLLYISKMLGEIWQKGFHTIGEVNFKTAGYVARYVTKKHFGKNSDYVYDGLEPEFAVMSRGQKKNGKGGIGKQWFEKYWNDVYPKDYIVINGKKYRPPKYYDDLMMKKNPKLMNWVKAHRELKQEKVIPDSSIRQMEKEKYRKCVASRLERTLDNGNY